MLIPSSFRISPHVIQASLGDSQRWIVEGERGIAFIDGCASDEVSLLEQRISKLEIQLDHRAVYRLFTADDAERLYFPAELTARSKAIVTNKGRKNSPPGLFEISADSAALDLGAVTIKRIPLALATPSSAAYFIEPDGLLVVDQSLGFYRGKEIPAPGAGLELIRSVESLRSLAELTISGLSLPWSGTLTGALALQHISGVIQVTGDLIQEFSENFGTTVKNSTPSPSMETLASELYDSLYHIPEDFIKNPSPRFVRAIRKAGDETCRALMSFATKG